MGRGVGGCGPWRRLHELGDRVLSACGQGSESARGFSRKSGDAAVLIRGLSSSCLQPSSVAGVKVDLGKVISIHVPVVPKTSCSRNCFTTLAHPQHLVFEDSVRGLTKDFIGNGSSQGNWSLEIWSNSKRRSSGHLVRCIVRPMSSVCHPPNEQLPIVEQEPFPVFSSQKFTQSASRMVSSGNFRRESGFDMGTASRSQKLPVTSAFESFRSNAPLGLKMVEATATSSSLAGAGEAVDWQHQRIRVREYDSRDNRPRTHQPSSPTDAEPDDIFIPVKAFYISRSVDLKALAREPFSEVTTSRNNLIIRCADRPPHSPVTADNPEMACLGFLKERYMVAFQYGSVVFFNFGDHEEVESLDIVRKYCSDEFRETRKDDYGVLVRPTLPEWSEGGHDRVMLRKLDIDNIRVISSILGQSIALDHYAKKVDEMVTTFSELNRGMEQTGTFTMTRKSLFQLVAAANTTLADVILRLGLLERSDAAWKDANYAQIWEYMRDDFELDERFESLDFKLNIIQHNVRFFLEILQNRKSDTLEWIIILLITGEICVSLYDILHTAGAI
ncbi:required for meiotic nuclear division protein 1 [Marchantia polymorpha subsp. ruderalis]|uniref:DUF155 domain-containing protein n=2 Tax=Marchantia polymorpha TaxID=3197 RepID=A0AAF6BRA9_MARPO|nr:hypothetical protein MARPO_0059s0101 [Marchantia polymorpha]BBN14543.1 hypothetical protein Mp_6g12450 [Marchantia polymorpha subsp. ruderalis]|eukprot:PTQ37177.1 hypothetical protein MARPO_0059s0101 [Marchantia polymorpha]